MEPTNINEIVGEGEPSVPDKPGGVVDHQTSEAAPADQNQGVEASGLQETSNPGGQRKLSMMPKVPAYIRHRYNSGDYDPLVASFGPYNLALHHAPDQRLALVEEFKSMAVAWFVNGTGKDANFWLTKVWYMVPDLRRCYTEESLAAYGNAELTRLLFHDACLAILVMGVANKEYQDIRLLLVCLGVDTANTTLRDSFLLENQLPFWFIRDLLHSKFGVSKGEERWRKHFMSFCHTRITTPVYWDEKAGEPAHSVEALKIAYLSGWKKEEIEQRPIEAEQIVLFRYAAVHSVTELKAKGIYVKPNSANSYKNITFQSNCLSGTLRVPVNDMDHISKAAYTNIIAYEMSPENRRQDFTMTSYVHLMKSLLQSPKDVEELQANGTIKNMLGSNEQVMNLYKDIHTFGLNCSTMYEEVCRKMEVHYNKKTKTWFAELLHTYFRSPWTVIALFGSILIVVLTIMQVYYAASDANKGGDKGKLHPSPPSPLNISMYLHTKNLPY